MLGVGAKSKTYIDDLFNTDLWIGDGATHQVVNNINLSSGGGMVWMKSRSHANNHLLADTVRGSNKVIFPDSNAVEQTSTGYFTSFNSNGFTTGDSDYVHESGKEMAGWTFKKSKGFFDVVSYNGTGSAQTIAHSLGSVPGMIMIKRTGSSTTGHWIVYHRELTSNAVYLALNQAWTEGNTDYWNSTAPTSTHFSIKDQDNVNADGGTYIAYLFAGGESTADTARSVAFDGDTDELVLGNTNDFDFGANDFTIECWVKPNSIAYTSYYKRIWSFGSADNNSMTLNVANDGTIEFRINNSQQISTDTNSLQIGGWSHLALVRHSNKIKLYLNGIQVGSTYSYTSTIDWSQSGEDLYIGTQIGNDSSSWNGKISNFRVVKGTAVYTTAFLPSTTPLTNISNTVLLCCNNSSITDATVKPGAISSAGNPTASIDSPFDDPAGFKFGENEDQNLIKCGSFIGGGSDYREVYVGFEPQWILLKNADASTDWKLFDCMRGLSTDAGDDAILDANENVTEISQGANALSITPTGFKPVNSSGQYNGDGEKIIYIAIRRPDGYVGKLAEAGTDVFAMDTGSGNTALPNYDSNFPVDFALSRQPASAENWLTHARLTSTNYLRTDTTGAESSWQNFVFDSNVGWAKGGYSSSYQSWMWKRHAGFDVVTYKGDGTAGRQIRHNLNKVPEMIWTKKRDDTEDWIVYHKDLNGGTNPANWFLTLNLHNAQGEQGIYWNNTVPTSVAVTVGSSNRVNNNNSKYISMLFASVEGISKVGSFTGSSSDVTITTGFQPRFVVIKSTSQDYPWMVLDSVRGWGSSDDSGDDPYLRFNQTDAQVNYDNGYKTSTGFVVDAGSAFVNNGSSSTYIYYAHA